MTPRAEAFAAYGRRAMAKAAAGSGAGGLSAATSVAGARVTKVGPRAACAPESALYPGADM